MDGKKFPTVREVIELENIEQPIKYVVDAETGDIEDGMFEGDRIMRKKQREYLEKNRDELEKDKIRDFGQDKRFSMLSSYSAKQLADEKLTGAEYRVLLIMISNTNYKSGLVTLANNHPMTVDWVTKTLNITKKTTEKCFRVLADKGIIHHGTSSKKTKTFFNPYIQYKGRWINKTLYDMFKDSKWAKRDNK